MESKTLNELAELIGAELIGGDPSLRVTAVNTLEDAQPGQISFFSNPKYEKHLATTKASAVIVDQKVKVENLTLLRAKNPSLAYQKAMVALHGQRTHLHTGVHPKANVDPTATIGPGTIVYPGVYIGPQAKIGRDCILYPNVVIYDHCVLGDRVIIHGGAVIGADGFGYATADGIHHKIPQIGNVVIEDDVEIGANSTVDRAALGSTLVGKGTKIDNLATLGHNVQTGPGCLIVAQAGVAGSTTLGHHVVLGGQVGVAGHIELGDGVMAGAQCGISNSVEAGQIVLGSPAMPIGLTRRIFAVWRDLPELPGRLKSIERQLEKLSGGKK